MVQIALDKVAPEEIRAELDRILSSPDFSASKRRRGFLRFVVKEALAGRAEMIKEYTIAVTVFGRSKDFDSQCRGRAVTARIGTILSNRWQKQSSTNRNPERDLRSCFYSKQRQLCKRAISRIRDRSTE